MTNETITRNVKSIAIEFGPSRFHVVICEGRQRTESVHTESVLWRREATTLNSNQGLAELSDALTEFCREKDLAGHDVEVVLGGEYCITRYVSGSEQAVAERLDELEARCARYLLLGNGRKVGARLVRALDERTHLGLLTVANYRTIETLSNATKRAGIQIASISASVVLMSGLVKQVCVDNTAGLMVRPREDGLDLCVVDGGQLLLDVRPAQSISCDEVDSYVGERLALLERFFGGNAISSNRKLERVFVCGDENHIQQITDRCSDRNLLIDNLNTRIAEMHWPLSPDADVRASCAALAASFGSLPGTTAIARPDLLTVLQGVQTGSLKVNVAKTLWPMAAAILMCVMLQGLTSRETSLAEANIPVVEQSNSFGRQKRTLQRECKDLKQEATQLALINSQLSNPAWQNVVAIIGSCLSDNAKLETISIDQEGVLKMRGTCGTEQSVYQFVENIDQLPIFRKTALSGTSASGTSSAATVAFDVQTQITDVSILKNRQPTQMNPTGHRRPQKNDSQLPERTALAEDERV